MKVKKLIEILKQFDGEKEVKYLYEDYVEAEGISIEELKDKVLIIL